MSAAAGPAERSALLPARARELFRGGLVTPTAGWCDGFAQANLMVVPRDWAFELLLFAQRNPKPCPVLAVLDAGEVSGPVLGDGDVRTDLPLYSLYREGEAAGTRTDVLDVWQDDFVTFALGCSFTFEAALQEAGIPVAHIDQGVNVPMYRTSLPCEPAGRLSGPLVVSMRPIPADRVADAVRITSRYPAVHGAPVHVGAPGELGIRDLSAPDYGDAVQIPAGHLPVFWACGVTPQAAVLESGVPVAIGHAPGHMLVTDVPNWRYQVP
ncbi:putative hydro-lyase [Kocuria turfanensis]|nr:putative hydro-lyase [Kocuria turfanensis]